MKEIELLNNLVSDIECLEPLNEWISDINIFEVLKLSRTEIRHSNMLSWLLSPNGQHGLQDKLLKKILIYATTNSNIKIMKGISPVDIDIMDFSDIEIHREKNNIDILLVSEKNNLVCAIENKIGTGEHDDQLNKYRNLLIKEYGDKYRIILIYLTPEGMESSDVENWITMDYNFIIDQLSNLIETYNIPSKAKEYIIDYINSIRRHVVEDKSLKEICKKIYLKHKEAFDLIFDNKPDYRSTIADYCYNFLKEKAERFDITIWPNDSNSYIRFTPNKLVDLYGKMGSGEWCGNDNLVCFEIQNFKDYDLNIKVVIGPSKSEFQNVRQELLDKGIRAGYKMKGKSLTNKWKSIKSDTLLKKNKCEVFDYDEFQDDTLGIPLENYLLNELPKIINDLSTK